MGTLYRKYGSDDLDIAALYAESLMVLKAWELWVMDESTAEIVPADSDTLLVQQVLTKVCHRTGTTAPLGNLHLLHESLIFPSFVQLVWSSRPSTPPKILTSLSIRV